MPKECLMTNVESQAEIGFARYSIRHLCFVITLDIRH